ncbi:MAG: hypothetical protein NT031_09335, partial [Planctomycetota bacterium]|nr:hypothetical protein [Planctomycetota bacterium]
MYTIETRELTADEASRTRPCIRDAIEGVILLVMIGIGLGFAAFGLGVLLQWVLEKFGILVGAWLPWSLGTATSVVIAGLLLFFFAFRTHRPVGLQIGTTVESIAVEGARAVRVGGEEDEEPLVVLDIGGGKL